jgi:hypothetical protein
VGDTQADSPIKDIWQRFPLRLDPEWIALEVYEEDDPGNSDSDEDHDSESEGVSLGPSSKHSNAKTRRSLDSKVMAQIKNISARPSLSQHSTSSASSRPPSQEVEKDMLLASHSEFVARSPFGAINTSLSLMEMLIRLASLQEFQQASHLSIPDHILTFFLEESSTTGLKGHEQWRVRHEAKQKVGFDPYTDSL